MFIGVDETGGAHPAAPRPQTVHPAEGHGSHLRQWHQKPESMRNLLFSINPTQKRVNLKIFPPKYVLVYGFILK